jgi:hypothetical protein
MDSGPTRGGTQPRRGLARFVFRLISAVGLLLMGMPCAAQYLARGDLGETPPRVSLRDLLANHGTLPDIRKARLETEREIHTLKAAAAQGAPDDRDNYAVGLIRLGAMAEATTELTAILRDHPGRTRTLHNLAVMQIRQGKFSEALVTLTDLDKAAPGYADGLVAGLRVLVEFRRAQALRADWSQRNLLTPELTQMWEQRMAEGDTPPDASAGRSAIARHQPPMDSLVGMLRRFPEFGDGWASLGLMHEVQGDLFTAWKCYRIAIAKGTGLRSPLERHVRLIEPKARSQDPANLIGPKAIYTLIGVAILAVIIFLLRFGRAAAEDIRTVRNDPDRAAKKQGSYGPLGEKPLD